MQNIIKKTSVYIGGENKLHWTFDIAFSEDASRKRNKNSAQNYSVLLKIALNLLKNEKTEKQGIAGKRLKAAWNEDYLLNTIYYPDLKVWALKPSDKRALATS